MSFKISESVETPWSACPYCGATVDATTGITGDDRPEPGDASICFYCCGLLVFGDDLRVREPTDDELPKLLANELLMIAQQALRESKRRRR